MKVFNMTSNKGNKIANQFIITVDNWKYVDSETHHITDYEATTFFQSYESVIVAETSFGDIYLDKKYWNYSNTTSKYRNIFLNETTKETEQKIKDGTYILTDLN